MCSVDLEQRGIAVPLESNVHIHKKGDETDCSKYHGILLLSASYKILSNILLSRLIMQMKLLGITNVDLT
jgi:hypothetical protein